MFQDGAKKIIATIPTSSKPIADMLNKFLADTKKEQVQKGIDNFKGVLSLTINPLIKHAPTVHIKDAFYVLIKVS